MKPECFASDACAVDFITDMLMKARDFEDIERAGILFHGTGEPLEGPLRAASADGLLWTARTPAVAQAYIPPTGITSYLSIDAHNLRQRVSPLRRDAISLWALDRANVTLDQLDIELDGRGDLKSWRIPPNWPYWGDAKRYLEELGYAPGRTGAYELSVSFEDGEERLKAAEWRLPGHLMILYVPDLDISVLGGEGDLSDPQHLWQDKFDSEATSGASAIEIGDFLQSRRWGNIGHRSIGLFPETIARARYFSIPATNHDFTSIRDLSRPETPEFSAAWKSIRQRAMAPAEPTW